MNGRVANIFRRWKQPQPTQRRNASLTRTEGQPATAEPSRGGHPPRSLRYPHTTLGRLLDQSAERFPDVPAIIYEGVNWSYAELLRLVNRASGGLAHMGVRPGDRVLMTLPNCPEFVILFLAAQKLGARVVNAGPLLGADDLNRLMELTEPRLVACLDLQAVTTGRLTVRNEPVPHLFISLSGYQGTWKRLGYWYKLWMGEHREGNDRNSAMPFAELLETAPPRPPTVRPDPDDIAVLQPTGGTTGVLKVAQLSHRNLLTNATQVCAWMGLIPGQGCVLGVLPMFHAYGLTTILIAGIYSAGTMLPLTRFRVEQLMATIRRHQPTVMPLVPTIIHQISEELERRPDPEFCNAVRAGTVTSGAAPLPSETEHWFHRLTGATVAQGYGLTEASPVTHICPVDAPRSGSIGMPMPDTLARIVDLENPHRDMPTGEAGELLISGPQVFTGYLNDPEQTRHMLITDSRGRQWLRTGDVSWVDEDGYFYLLDRKKNMINRGGEKVWAAKVEQVLLQHRQINDAAVVGRPDDRGSERVVAILTTANKPTAEADINRLVSELRALCSEHLGPHEIPERFQFVDELPRTGLGKLMKHQLPDHDSADTSTTRPDNGRAENGPLTGLASPDQSESHTQSSVDNNGERGNA